MYILFFRSVLCWLYEGTNGLIRQMLIDILLKCSIFVLF